MNYLIYHFFLLEVFWCNFLRFFIHKLNLTLPPSLLYGVTSVLYLLFVAIRSKTFYLNFSIKKSIIPFTILFFCFFYTKIFSEILQNENRFSTKDIATIYAYFIFPGICAAIGALSRNLKLNTDVRSISLHTHVVLVIFLITTIWNYFDITFYSTSSADMYAGFSTTAPALVGENILQRLTGAYFSSVDFTFGAISILFLISQYRGLLYSISRLLILLAITLTFTRNAYLLATVVWLSCRFGLPSIKVYFSMLIAGILVTGASLIYMLVQLAAGEWLVTDQFSSIATRISSWQIIITELTKSPYNFLFGIGYSQNYLSESVFEVYAIDNMYLELFILFGLIGLACSFYFLITALKLTRLENNPLNNFTSGILISAPFFGIFNNFFGWSMFCLLFSVIFSSNNSSSE